MVERVQDTPDIQTALIVMGTVRGLPFEATVQALDLDLLAELALNTVGREAWQGPVHVRILSAGPVTGAAR